MRKTPPAAEGSPCRYSLIVPQRALNHRTPVQAIEEWKHKKTDSIRFVPEYDLAQDAMAESLAEQMGQVTAQMMSKNMNIAPTIEIRPGYRSNVMVTKDMTFNTPYQSFDYWVFPNQPRKHYLSHSGRFDSRRFMIGRLLTHTERDMLLI
ncbi:MAG: hypothetical protein LBO00_04385 [Zoogloeaceae bacterium]|nr:hypothetical protein [Zoogloeaceae bacterium]